MDPGDQVFEPEVEIPGRGEEGLVLCAGGESLCGAGVGGTSVVAFEPDGVWGIRVRTAQEDVLVAVKWVREDRAVVQSRAGDVGIRGLERWVEALEECRGGVDENGLVRGRGVDLRRNVFVL